MISAPLSSNPSFMTSILSVAWSILCAAILTAGEDDSFRYTDQINTEHSRSIAQIQILYGDVFGGMKPLDSIEDIKAKFVASKMGEQGWTLTEEDAYKIPPDIKNNYPAYQAILIQRVTDFSKEGFHLAPMFWVVENPLFEKDVRYSPEMYPKEIITDIAETYHSKKRVIVKKNYTAIAIFSFKTTKSTAFTLESTGVVYYATVDALAMVPKAKRSSLLKGDTSRQKWWESKIKDINKDIDPGNVPANIDSLIFTTNIREDGTPFIDSLKGMDSDRVCMARELERNKWVYESALRMGRPIGPAKERFKCLDWPHSAVADPEARGIWSLNTPHSYLGVKSDPSTKDDQWDTSLYLTNPGSLPDGAKSAELYQSLRRPGVLLMTNRIVF